MRCIDADALLEKVWDADTRAGYVQVVDRGDIEEAPTIEPEPQWIPCSERLPEKPKGEKEYWFDDCAIAADEYIVMIKDAILPTMLFWSGEMWFEPNGWDVGYTYSVIAWMPLPKPYTGGEKNATN